MFIELHRKFLDSIKIERLAERLGIAVPIAGYMTIQLWLRTLDISPVDGRLSDLTPAEIAQRVGWDGDPQRLIDALTDHRIRLLDVIIMEGGEHRYAIHNWEKYTIFLRKRLRDAKRKRDAYRAELGDPIDDDDKSPRRSPRNIRGDSAETPQTPPRNIRGDSADTSAEHPRNIRGVSAEKNRRPKNSNLAPSLRGDSADTSTETPQTPPRRIRGVSTDSPQEPEPEPKPKPPTLLNEQPRENQRAHGLEGPRTLTADACIRIIRERYSRAYRWKEPTDAHRDGLLRFTPIAEDVFEATVKQTAETATRGHWSHWLALLQDCEDFVSRTQQRTLLTGGDSHGGSETMQ